VREKKRRGERKIDLRKKGRAPEIITRYYGFRGFWVRSLRKIGRRKEIGWAGKGCVRTTFTFKRLEQGWEEK